MDVFIRSLSFTSNTTKLEDFISPCFRIINWVTFESRSQLSYNDVETMIKCAVYIDECFLRFDKELETALINHNPYQEIFLRKYLQEIRSPNCISFVCIKILQSENGLSHVAEIMAILKAIGIDNQFESILKKFTAISSTFSSITITSGTRQQMWRLVEKLFQLPSEQINVAIEQMLMSIHFKIIGHIFLEPQISPYSARCLVIEQAICDRVQRCEISCYFLRSLFVTTASSDVGLQFYWKCLSNVTFAESLSELFYTYLQSLALDDNDQYRTKNQSFEKYMLSDMLFLIHGALDSRSPCQTELYRKLSCTGIPRHLMNTIHRITFVCN